MASLRTSTSRVKTSASALIRRVQSSVRKVAVSGDKNIFLTMSPEKKEEYGILIDVDQEQINKLDVEQLYEIVYGGNSQYFDSEAFVQQKKDEEEYLANSTRTLNVEDSIYRCPRCKYNRIIVGQKQLRGMDEGMSTLMKCTNCNFEWRKD